MAASLRLGMIGVSCFLSFIITTSSSVGYRLRFGGGGAAIAAEVVAVTTVAGEGAALAAATATTTGASGLLFTEIGFGCFGGFGGFSWY